MKAYGKANRNLDRSPRADAETALAALSFLARDPDRTSRFLVSTGLTPDALRRAAGEPGFAESILAYLMSDEALLLVFCEEEGIDPASLAEQHRAMTYRRGEASF